MKWKPKQRKQIGEIKYEQKRVFIKIIKKEEHNEIIIIKNKEWKNDSFNKKNSWVKKCVNLIFSIQCQCIGHKQNTHIHNYTLCKNNVNVNLT